MDKGFFGNGNTSTGWEETDFNRKNGLLAFGVLAVEKGFVGQDEVIEALEEQDDVQNVYSDFDIDDKVLESLG